MAETPSGRREPTGARKRSRLRTVLFAAGVAAAVVAATLAASVAGPGELYAPPYPRVDCARAAELVEEAVRRERHGPVVVLEARRHRMAAEQRSVPGHYPGEGDALYTLECEDITLLAAGALLPGSRGVETMSPSAFLIRPSPRGYIEVERVCLGCDDVGEDDARGMAELARSVELILCVVSFVLFAAWRVLRPMRLERALRRAPRSAEDRPTTFSAARIVPIGGGEPTELDGRWWSLAGARPAPASSDVVPRLELPPRDAPFREQHATMPSFSGPGRVNGLAVRRGEATPLRGGDVIATRRRRYELQLDGEAGVALRYHAAADPALLRLALARQGFYVGRGVAGVLTFLTVVALVGGEAVAGWSAVGAIAGACLLAVALLTPLWVLKLVDVETAAVESVRLVDLGRGGYDLVFAGRVAEALFVEHVPGWQGAGSAEERALRRALRVEAEEIARRFRGARTAHATSE
jgi:hypothetical protein